MDSKLRSLFAEVDLDFPAMMNQEDLEDMAGKVLTLLSLRDHEIEILEGNLEDERDDNSGLKSIIEDLEAQVEDLEAELTDVQEG